MTLGPDFVGVLNAVLNALTLGGVVGLVVLARRDQRRAAEDVRDLLSLVKAYIQLASPGRDKP